MPSKIVSTLLEILLWVALDLGRIIAPAGLFQPFLRFYGQKTYSLEALDEIMFQPFLRFYRRECLFGRANREHVTYSFNPS